MKNWFCGSSSNWKKIIVITLWIVGCNNEVLCACIILFYWLYNSSLFSDHQVVFDWWKFTLGPFLHIRQISIIIFCKTNSYTCVIFHQRCFQLFYSFSWNLCSRFKFIWLVYSLLGDIIIYPDIVLDFTNIIRFFTHFVPFYPHFTLGVFTPKFGSKYNFERFLIML